MTAPISTKVVWPAPRPVCGHCGKKHGARGTVETTLPWPEGEPEPRYKGRGVVVKETLIKARLGYAASIYGPTPGRAVPAEPAKKRFEIWDGETWLTRYAPFCTLRCALDYARKAYEAAQTL